MGAQVSKRPGGGAPELPVGAAELSSYTAACRADPDLRSFDAALRERTSHAISSLAAGVELRSLSFDSLRAVTGCLLDMNQEVVRVVLQCKKDIWNNPDLFGLVEEYFDSSLRTLDFCAALEKCLNRARDSQLIVHVALRRFNEEAEQEVMESAAEGDRNNKNKYMGTLEELRQFKEAGDLFTEEFFHVFRSVYAQQLNMLDKLHQRRKKLDKQLRSIGSWRKVSSIIFGAAFAAVLICSVVAAAVAAPPVIVALAAAAAVPAGSVGQWIDSLLRNYQNAVKGQREVISSMQVGGYIVIKDLDGIRVLVDRLEVQIDSLLGIADFAQRDEEAVKLAVEEIKKKLEVFMKSIEELGEQADQCSRDIRRARTVVLQRIIKYPN